MKLEDFNDRDISANPLNDQEVEFLNQNVDKLTQEQADKFGVDKPADPYIPQPPTDPKPGEGKKTEGDGGDGGDDDLDEEEERKISKLMDKRMGGFMRQTQQQATQYAVDSFIRTEEARIPTASRYRDAMLQTMANPKYSGLSPSEVFSIVARDEIMRIGAKRERDAANKARGTQTNASLPPRSSNGAGKNWANASPEEVARKKAEVLGHL